MNPLAFLARWCEARRDAASTHAIAGRFDPPNDIAVARAKRSLRRLRERFPEIRRYLAGVGVRR